VVQVLQNYATPVAQEGFVDPDRMQSTQLSAGTWRIMATQSHPHENEACLFHLRPIGVERQQSGQDKGHACCLL
jgi:hypothetical protein